MFQLHGQDDRQTKQTREEAQEAKPVWTQKEKNLLFMGTDIRGAIVQAPRVRVKRSGGVLLAVTKDSAATNTNCSRLNELYVQISYNINTYHGVIIFGIENVQFII